MGYLYSFTPKGMTEKAEITRWFLKNKIKEYDRLKGEIKALRILVGGNAGMITVCCPPSMDR